MAIVAPDLGLDTSTTTGRMVAHILAAVAEAEGEVIGQRTSVALIAKRSRGEYWPPQRASGTWRGPHCGGPHAGG